MSGRQPKEMDVTVGARRHGFRREDPGVRRTASLSHTIRAASLLLIFLTASVDAQERPLTVARQIAERVMRETPLELRMVPRKALPGLHVLDFGLVFGSHPAAVAYATSAVHCSQDTILRFGISNDCPVRVAVNGATVFASSTGRAFRFQETGYDLYEYSDSVAIPLRKGENALLVKAVLARGRNAVLFRELCPPKATPAGRFEPRSASVPRGADPWLYTGTFSGGGDPLTTTYPPEVAFLPWYHTGGVVRNWRTAPLTFVSELVIDPTAVYSRESYAEWMYPSGTVLLSMLQLSAATGDTAYEQFVRRVCDFTAEHIPLFSHQYHEQHDFRGTDYRIFRRSMLDDTGAPVLPYIEVQPLARSAWIDSLVSWMAEYVSAGQVRLPDGTLCRYEHRPFTVWGDDLFMSVPFLVRLGRKTGEARFFDDASRQVLNFHRYLSDRGTGLYHHAYYHFAGRRSPVLWGRANGWIVWAHTEALKHLPKSHPTYAKIAGLFRQHLDAVIRVQGRSGLWHQILDDAGSFEETSCTAMFMIGMARGITLGILGEEYRLPLRKALTGLRSRIGSDGVVRDITRGTEVSDDPAYYRARERYPNDPRGLGAVITALIEAEAVPGLLEPAERNQSGEPR